jgi:hypothetical protein
VAEELLQIVQPKEAHLGDADDASMAAPPLGGAE